MSSDWGKSVRTWFFVRPFLWILERLPFWKFLLRMAEVFRVFGKIEQFTSEELTSSFYKDLESVLSSLRWLIWNTMWQQHFHAREKRCSFTGCGLRWIIAYQVHIVMKSRCLQLSQETKNCSKIFYPHAGQKRPGDFVKKITLYCFLITRRCSLNCVNPFSVNEIWRGFHFIPVKRQFRLLRS